MFNNLKNHLKKKPMTFQLLGILIAGMGFSYLMAKYAFRANGPGPGFQGKLEVWANIIWFIGIIIFVLGFSGGRRLFGFFLGPILFFVITLLSLRVSYRLLVWDFEQSCKHNQNAKACMAISKLSQYFNEQERQNFKIQACSYANQSFREIWGCEGADVKR